VAVSKSRFNKKITAMNCEAIMNTN